MSGALGLGSIVGYLEFGNSRCRKGVGEVSDYRVPDTGVKIQFNIYIFLNSTKCVP